MEHDFRLGHSQSTRHCCSLYGTCFGIKLRNPVSVAFGLTPSTSTKLPCKLHPGSEVAQAGVSLKSAGTYTNIATQWQGWA